MLMLIALFFSFVLPAAPLPSPAGARITVADGSVWGDVVGDAGVRASTRLCDRDPGTRWLRVDVDGDGRQDLVAIRPDGEGVAVAVWRQHDDTFTPALRLRFPPAPGPLG